jgi:hypothetical protein
MFETFQSWVSPGIWLVLSLLWLGPAILAIRWPGGAGAIILLIGTVGNLFCFLVSAADTYAEVVTGSAVLDWDSPLFTLLDIGFLVSFALQLAGFFMLVLRIRPMTQRLRELEALAPRA